MNAYGGGFIPILIYQGFAGPLVPPVSSFRITDAGERRITDALDNRVTDP